MVLSSQKIKYGTWKISLSPRQVFENKIGKKNGVKKEVSGHWLQCFFATRTRLCHGEDRLWNAEINRVARGSFGAERLAAIRQISRYITITQNPHLTAI